MGRGKHYKEARPIMIVFLSFAPLEFQGGAERTLIELFETVSPNLANIYSRLILGRKFDKRKRIEIKSYRQISLTSFIPFSKKYLEIRDKLLNARLIYLKAELNEILILLYFGGISSLRKTILGVRSAWIYVSPHGFLDRLHNLIYRSFFLKKICQLVKRIHVLNHQDEIFFKYVFKINEVYRIPIYIDDQIYKISHQNSKSLNIVFIGELVYR